MKPTWTKYPRREGGTRGATAAIISIIVIIQIEFVCSFEAETKSVRVNFMICQHRLRQLNKGYVEKL